MHYFLLIHQDENTYCQLCLPEMFHAPSVHVAVIQIMHIHSNKCTFPSHVLRPGQALFLRCAREKRPPARDRSNSIRGSTGAARSPNLRCDVIFLCWVCCCLVAAGGIGHVDGRQGTVGRLRQQSKLEAGLGRGRTNADYVRNITHT